jgi:hypothetical protein
MTKTGWNRPFEDPILLPDGRELLTLKDAADYIMKLPKAEQKHEKWQTAAEVLIMAAEGRGPLMHARIGVLQALTGTSSAYSKPVRKRRIGESESSRGIGDERGRELVTWQDKPADKGPQKPQVSAFVVGTRRMTRMLPTTRAIVRIHVFSLP